MNDIQSHRNAILQAAARHGASDVRIFGSVVRGQSHQASDLDVLVHLDEDCSLLDQIGLMHELENLLGCKVDVVEDEALNRTIRDRILSEARPL
jgi:predicted nucleotidyltransferase